MMTMFAGRVALVTGAASGIGRQLALDLAREGAAVAAIDLQADPLAVLAAEVPGKKIAWAVGDVTDRGSLGDAVARAGKEVGTFDLVIANAGIGRENSALDFRAEDFEAQVRVNLIGVANTFEIVLPAMIERRQGHLVAISSLASYRGIPRMLGYCASKSGVNALMEGMRVELKPHGIFTTTICPGWIRTPLTANIDLPAGALMELPEASHHILDAVCHRRTFYAFPRRGVRQVRLLRWLPPRLSDWLTAQRVPTIKK
jgi:NAD(P)-dependent dehydrogenase (short-subunit alcohol dehydrogenase family)